VVLQIRTTIVQIEGGFVNSLAAGRRWTSKKGQPYYRQPKEDNRGLVIYLNKGAPRSASPCLLKTLVEIIEGAIKKSLPGEGKVGNSSATTARGKAHPQLGKWT